jgi:hypothetical protein
MKLFEGKTPAERNKLIAAIVLGVLAFSSLAYMFLGSSSSSKPKNQNSNNQAATKNSTGELLDKQATTASPSTPEQLRKQVDDISPPSPVTYQHASYSVPEPGRNIFAFYVPPPKVVKPVVIPPPTPTPTPPLVLAGLSPSNVYARTGEFTLEVSGDKFTPTSAIIVDNNPLPTRFVNAQQLSATVPASMIGQDGARQIMVKTPDNLLYSNPLPLMVSAPPLPNYLYIGIIGKVRHNDTAILKDKSNPKELLNVQRGDVLGGRFRVTSISEREIVLTGATLRIKHALPFIEEKGTGGQAGTQGNPGRRNTPLLEESGIPGIPNVPRYQPPVRAEQQPAPADNNDDDGEEIAPGIPKKQKP